MSRWAPYALISAVAVALALAFLSLAFAEARARVRGYLELKASLDLLEGRRPPGAPRRETLERTRLHLELRRAQLVRDGILPAAEPRD